jgi:hypothetical protein
MSDVPVDQGIRPTESTPKQAAPAIGGQPKQVALVGEQLISRAHLSTPSASSNVASAEGPPPKKPAAKQQQQLSAAQELDVLIRARYPIIYVTTWEEERVERCLREIAKRREISDAVSPLATKRTLILSRSDRESLGASSRNDELERSG